MRIKLFNLCEETYMDILNLKNKYNFNEKIKK